MKIEVQVGNQESVIYPIKSNRIVIGSGEASHIHLPSSSGVSRKHLEILVEGDKFFAKDLGSTNGTFINDERLVPGSKTPFTSFFPIMLGETVTILLLSDDDKSSGKAASSIAAPKKESVVRSESNSFNEHTAGTKTKTLISSKEGAKAKPKPMIYKKADPKITGLSDNARMKMAMGVVAVIVGLGAFYKSHLNPDKSLPGTLAETNTQRAAAQTSPQPLIPNGPRTVPDDKLPPIEEIQRAFVDFKCGTTLEKSLCSILPDTNNSRAGVLVTIDYILIMLPEEKWYHDIFMDKKTHLYVNHHLSAKDKTTYLSLLSFAEFKPFQWQELDKNIFFVFFRMKDNVPAISSITGIVPKELSELFQNLPKTIIAPATAYARPINVLPEYNSVLKIFDPTDEPDMPAPSDLTKPLKPLPVTTAQPNP